MPISTQTKSIYQYALNALEAERTRLDVMIADVRHQLKEPGKTAPIKPEAEPGPAKKTRKKRVMSPEGKARLIAALKARHAAKKAAKAEAAPAEPESVPEWVKPTTKKGAKKATKKGTKKAA